MKSSWILFILLLAALCFQAVAQQPRGLPVIRKYNPQDYGAHRQNWAIAQSSDGIMYFANGKGLLSFNGEEWHLIMMPNRGHVRSLAIAENGTVYVGANNDFGQLEAAPQGNLRFKSFLPLLTPEDRSFDRIRETIVDQAGVYFRSRNRLFRVDENSIKTWRSEGSFNGLFKIHENIFLTDYKKGLSVLNDFDKFELVPGGEFLKGTNVNAMMPFGESILIGTANQGLFTYQNGSFQPFQTDMDRQFKQYGINQGKITHDNKIIVSMRGSGGIALISTEGKLLHHITQENGLDSNVLNIFEDREHAIWAGLQEGLTRIAINSPFSIYDERTELEGSIQSILQHNGQLYAATSDGLARLIKGKSRWYFKDIGNLESYGWDLETWNDQLLIATTKGAYSTVDQEIKHTFDQLPFTSSIKRSIFREDVIYITTDSGFGEYQWTGDSWEERGEIDGIAGSVRDIEELNESELWLKTRSNGIFRIRLPLNNEGFNNKTAKIDQYTESKGVPPGENNLFLIDSHLYVRSENDSLFLYNADRDIFEKVTDLGNVFGIKNGYILPKKSGHNGIVWLDKYLEGRQYLIKATKNFSDDYSAEEFAVNELISSYKDPFGNEVFYGTENCAWFSGMNGVLQYNLVQSAESQKPFEVMLTKVLAGDSTLMSNYIEVKRNEIPYTENNIIFEFTSASYERIGLSYQYSLEGFDHGWSNWTSEYRKEYTSLPPGDYTFKLKAKNGYGLESDIISFRFKVLSPWYLSAIAIMFYALVLGALIWLMIYVRSRKYEKENLRLERLIAQRTSEMKVQADEIKDLYLVKSRFLSNISHELRTPLTLIMGPVKELMKSTKGEDRQQLEWIQRNSQRLLKLINQLLDLSKIEAGKITLRASNQNVISFSKGVLAFFDSLASQDDKSLIFQCKEEELFLYFDAEKLEQVLINLLSNALKFTTKGDKISMVIDHDSESVSIKVLDTGIGIHAQHLPYVFERFYQVEEPDSKNYQGTGMGLSISQELIDLHGGTLSVTSEYGEGSCFEIQLPLGKDHLSEDQIIHFHELQDQVEKEMVIVETDNDHLPEPGPTTTPGPSILVVDDNQDMRQFIRHQLQEQYHVLLAASGKEGLDLAIMHSPSLIVSDVMMPGMSGYELCRHLKSDPRTDYIPVVLLTAKAGSDEKIKGLEFQADDYLTKPFDAQELAIRVRNLITNRKKLQQRFAEKIIFQPEEVAVNPREQAFLEKLKDIMEERLSDQQLGVAFLCQEMGISRSQLNRKMQAILNKTPNAFIRSYRLERAKYLIENDSGSLAEISYDVGFSSPAYFSKCFHDEFGYPPKSLKI